jgi:alpha-N-arabinofuranosidase
LKENRWLNSYGLWGYDGREFPLQAGGNVYYNAAAPCSNETACVVLQDNPEVKLSSVDEHYFLQMTFSRESKQRTTDRVTTASLGTTRVAGLPYENADGSPIRIDSDYFGKSRSRSKPTVGPFERPSFNTLNVKVW